MKITNSDLHKMQFTEDILVKNIDNLNAKTIVNTQKLSPAFCIEHIVCMENIDSGDEDSYLFDIPYILSKQPHLKEEKLLSELLSLYNEKYKK